MTTAALLRRELYRGHPAARDTIPQSRPGDYSRARTRRSRPSQAILPQATPSPWRRRARPPLARRRGSGPADTASGNSPSTIPPRSAASKPHPDRQPQERRHRDPCRSICPPSAMSHPSEFRTGRKAGGHPCAPVFRAACRGRRPHTVCGRPLTGREPPLQRKSEAGSRANAR